MHKRLAINGGEKIRTELFPFYKTVGQEEIRAVTAVLESGILSKYLGAWHEDFYGGPQVQAFEQEWATLYGVKHAVSVNSNTSGLIAALGAIGIGPGDEVIVSPYSMSISATAPLFYGAVPVFADVEPDFFCLDPKSVEAAVTPRTRAIIAVDLFGNPYDADAINAIAKRHNLYVIEDAAQAPLTKHGARYAGTLGDIGVFSLNYHKHIHTGEGGMVVTNDDRLAERVRLIRNHAESVVEQKGETDLTNMIGFNSRMTEIEAAIGREQLKKLSGLVIQRRENVSYLADKLARIPFLRVAPTRAECDHGFYVQALLFDEALAGVHRDVFVEAVKAELAPTEKRESEGVHIGCGYVRPIYLLPAFQKRIAIGSRGFPFTDSVVRYERGMCPVVETLHESTLLFHHLIHPALTQEDLDDVVAAFEKVAANMHELTT